MVGATDADEISLGALADVFEDNLPDQRYRWSISEITSIAKRYGAESNLIVYNADPCFIDMAFHDGSSFKFHIWFKKFGRRAFAYL
jgi:hypothetical protein